jgi:hypothetical protein
LSFAGAFHYYITVVGEGGKVALPADSVGDGYFLVEPELVCRGLHCSVDSVVCQTVLSKLMGPLDTWEVGKALGSSCARARDPVPVSAKCRLVLIAIDVYKIRYISSAVLSFNGTQNIYIWFRLIKAAKYI